jgi:hypothetical protein
MAFDLRIDKGKKHDFPKSKSEWAEWICQLHDEALEDRRPQEFQWAVNFSYYMGQQNLHFSPLTGTLHRDFEQEELIINRVAPYVEVRISKLTRSKPILAVTPDSNGRDVVNGSKMSEKLLKHLWKTQDMDPKLRTFCFYLIVMGTAFFKDIWNPGIGDKIKVGEDDEEQEDDGFLNIEDPDIPTPQAPEPKEVFQGDIETFVKSPFAVLAAPGSTNEENAIWMMDRSHMTLREVAQLYPNIDPKEIETGPELTQYESFVNRLQSPIYANLSGFGNRGIERKSARRENDLVLVKEFWMKPNEIYPDGVVATVIGKKLVSFSTFPNGFKEYPFTRAVEKENPFNFYGQSSVTRVVPLQRRYNQARSQISKNASLFAGVKWSAPKGHGMHEDALTDEAGEIVEYNPNLPRPEQMGVAPMPNYVMESQLQDLKDIRDITGEIEAGDIPGTPQVTAGIALDTAQEIADIIVIPISRNVEQALIKLGRNWLINANENYLDPRRIKIIGEDNQVFVEEMVAADLRNQTDVTIQIESFLGSSKAAQQQKLLDMWDRRIINDPDSWLRAFVSGDISVITKSMQQYDAVIAEDIEAVKNGKQPVIQPFDNHVAFVKAFSEFIQTPEFRRMPPDRQQLAMVTLNQHLEMIQPRQEEDTNPAAVNTPFGSQVTEGS